MRARDHQPQRFHALASTTDYWARRPRSHRARRRDMDRCFFLRRQKSVSKRPERFVDRFRRSANTVPRRSPPRARRRRPFSNSSAGGRPIWMKTRWRSASAVAKALNSRPRLSLEGSKPLPREMLIEGIFLRWCLFVLDGEHAHNRPNARLSSSSRPGPVSTSEQAFAFGTPA